MPDENDNNSGVEVKIDTTEAFQNLLAKYNNNGVNLAAQLHDENFQLRKKIRDLKTGIPVSGSLVLSQDEAKQFKAFQDLGIEPDKAKEAIERSNVLETENKKLAKRDSFRALAKFDYDSDLVEEQMEKFPDAVITIKKQKDKQDSTKEIEVPFVSLDGKESLFEDFGNDKFPKLMPVLKVSNAAPTYIPGNPPNPQISGNSTGLFDRIRKEAEEKKKNAPQVASLRDIAGRIF